MCKPIPGTPQRQARLVAVGRRLILLDIETRNRRAQGNDLLDTPYFDPWPDVKRTRRRVLVGLIAIFALIVSVGVALADSLTPNRSYEGYLYYCLDATTALRIVEYQQEHNAADARRMFYASHVCYLELTDFMPIENIAVYAMDDGLLLYVHEILILGMDQPMYMITNWSLGIEA